jgi:hypothetical protein
MPIANIETTIDGYAAEWAYVPGEDVDFSEFTNISWLQIHAERESSLSQQPPYTIPSIASLFPNLLYLRIQKRSVTRFGYRMRRTLGHPCFIGHITDIPASVIDVVIEGTYITDLTTILQHGPNIRSFKLIHNLTHISMPIIQLPRGLNVFIIEESAFLDTTQLIFPTTIRSITCVRCHMMRTRLACNAAIHPMAWSVFPKPISSAIRHLNPVLYAHAMPSCWYLNGFFCRRPKTWS